MGPGFIKNIIAILKGKNSPQATAAGIAFGAMLGLLPKDNLLALFFFLLFFFTTVDKPAAIFASLFFTPIGLALDGIAHSIGIILLVKTNLLQSLWTTLYNLPIVPWTQFNNTVVMGQLVIGTILFVPLYLLSKAALAYYQKKLKEAVNKWKVIQAVKAFRLYQWWESIQQ